MNHWTSAPLNLTLYLGSGDSGSAWLRGPEGGPGSSQGLCRQLSSFLPQPLRTRCDLGQHLHLPVCGTIGIGTWVMAEARALTPGAPGARPRPGCCLLEAREPSTGAAERKKTPRTQRERRGGDVGESETPACRSPVCPSAHPPACPPPRDEAFLRGHVPAFLSSGGLKAHAGRFPFMYKGPLIQSDERRAAVGRGGDTGLGTFCRTGREATGHPSCGRASQAGLWTAPWAQAPGP